MTDITEKKGRVKEAAGTLVDDKELEREGKLEQGSGKIKEKIDDAVDKVKDAMHRDNDRGH